MFLNRLRVGILLVNKTVTSNIVESRVSSIYKFDAALFDVRKCEKLWKQQKDSEKLFKHLHNCFTVNQGSTDYIANVFRLACANCNCSLELVSNILNVYNQYLTESSPKYSLTKDQKIEVFTHILNYKNYNLLKLACEVFKITEQQKSDFTDFVNKLIQEEKLIQAAYCISIFKFQNEFPIQEIVLHLINDSKLHAAKTILKEYPELLLKTAHILDNLLDSKVVNASVNVRRVYKSLSEIVKHFNISLEECKNLFFIRRRGALHHLVKRKNQQSISESSFEEMVMNIVKEDKNLKEVLLQILLHRGDKETALKMQEKLNIPDFDLNSVTKIYNRRIDDIEEDEDDPLEFKLSSSDIKFISTKESYLDCISDIAQNYKMIGIDSEWKPQFGLQQTRLALVQLAVHDTVYILDMIALSNCLDAKDWDKLMDDIFSNSRIIKLGCGLMTDIQMMVENNSGTKGKVLRFSHILDIAVFYQKLQEVYPEEMVLVDDSNSDKNKLKSLSMLCKIILGKPLNKGERLCDWEKRPLTESQLEYAALDAYSLLMMYDRLKEISLERNINFEHLSKVAIVMTTSQWRPKKKPGKSRKNLESDKVQSQSPTPINRFKVAVQLDLGRHIKRFIELGADVLTLTEADRPGDVVLICKTEERILICSQPFKTKVHKIFPDLPCFAVTNDAEDHLPKILMMFNVKLNQNNVLPRCEVCDTEQILRFSPEEYKWLKHQELENQTDNSEISSLPTHTKVRIVNNMKKAGVKLKLDNSIPTGNVFVCIKCGNVQ